MPTSASSAASNWSNPEDSFDFRNPDYCAVFRVRAERLQRLRKSPSELRYLKQYYKHHIADFINDWGMTYDTREALNVAVMPFILFPKQRDWIEYTLRKWRAREPGLTEKSRDVGISWLAMSLSVSLCLFYENLKIGFGSATEDKVDRSGDPDCLFDKARFFLSNLPQEFRGGWDVSRHSAHMRMSFPLTASTITGEAGDKIGRGGRSALFFLDESAHIQHPQLVDRALSANTDCRQDASSVYGTANSLAIRRHSGAIEVFTFHWRDDPRKDDAWAQKKKAELVDLIGWNQEYEIAYSASVEGIVIPAEWVAAAIDAHIALKIEPTGIKRAALDVADQGIDKNALAIRHGNLLTHAESWSGSGSDIYATVERAFFRCDVHGLKGFRYDADGVGAGVQGDARKINDERIKQFLKPLQVSMFRGSGAVLDPERQMPGTDRKHKDMFENFKAMAWWYLRARFQATYRAVVEKRAFKSDDIISISRDFPERARLCIELSQPTYGQSKSGKILIEKQPEGLASPNLADAVMMLFAPERPALAIHDSLLEQND